MKQNSLPPVMLGVFLLSLLYWGYLALNTSMGISCDAIDYQKFGRLIQQHGFIPAYFENGPRNEPLYPLLVALSMQLEGISGVAYTRILAGAGVLILLLTQIMVYTLLRRLNIRTGICAAVLAYMGFSPALTNTAFSLYSEIITYPWILGIILSAAPAWRAIHRCGSVKTTLYGILWALLFLGATAVKSPFEIIFLFALSPFLWLMVKAIRERKKTIVMNVLFFLLSSVIVFETGILSYKNLNQVYNGHFALTDRAGWAFYASCARRAEKLTWKRLATAAAYIPGKGFCERIFGPDQCFFWGLETLNGFGLNKLKEVKQETPPGEVDSRLMTLSKEKIFERPAQFFLLMSFDGLKMFFWESTKIGFVEYPPWLSRIYDLPLLKDMLRLVVSLLSLAAFLFLAVMISKELGELFTCTVPPDPKIVIHFFLFLVLFVFIGLYSLFFTTPRFALPMIPLYIISIGIMADNIYARSHESPV
jgi:hypothetical protein